MPHFQVYNVAPAILESHRDGRHLFTCRVERPATGCYGFIPRVVPRGEPWLQFTPGLIARADGKK